MLGFINVYKPRGMTSSNVVVKIRKKFHIDKIGHMGTLDPLASGVLPIAVGKATRMFDYFLDKYKSYVAEFEFGYETDTLDIEGVKTEEGSKIPSLDELQDVLHGFVGKYNQIPPKYSAKSVNGIKAYKLARDGVNVELKPKEIEIKCLKLLSYNDGKVRLEVECSSGTYIRALGRDIAYTLNTLATMTNLERVQSGMFCTQNAVRLEELLDSDDCEKYLFSIPSVFGKIPQIQLSDEAVFKIRNGIAILNEYNIEKYCFVINNNELICVAENVDGKLKMKTYLAE
ncbi:MAG: tRNA pseudouridine(55) synthase TruB [Clostridiales bacterium]|nr:tRNA pseudouridine(55) synthase TruB [Clostridiales bacterium]